VCLNWGCIPTKALLRSAEIVGLLQRGKEFGFRYQNLEIDFGVAVDRSQQVAERLVRGIGLLMQKNQVEVLDGTGMLRSPTQVEVKLGTGETRELATRHVIVATGGRAGSIPGVLPDGERVLTYRQAIVLRDVPQSVIIVGGGPIGVEFAHIWSTYGSHVTVVEMLAQVLPLEDKDVGQQIQRILRRRRIKALTSTRVLAVDVSTKGVSVRVADARGEKILEAEKVLVSTGIQPNSDGLGLEALGVHRDQGYISVDGQMRTNVPGLFAIGDVTGKLALAHVASAQGIIASETIAGQEVAPLNYDTIPRCTYCQPQVASFGFTEARATELGYAVEIGRFPFLASGKGRGLGETDGFVKIIVDANAKTILGAHLVGPEVTELLPELTLACRKGLSAKEIARSVHAHPTLSEAVMEAAQGTFGQAIHL
jgi:dihydrolipoamide dehydrogenase